MRLGLPSFPYYRFTALERRSIEHGVAFAASGPGIQHFGLLEQEINGQSARCRAKMRNATYLVRNSSMILSLGQTNEDISSNRFTGWYFVTSDQPTSEDPVRLHALQI
jgi:hypothetical protein